MGHSFIGGNMAKKKMPTDTERLDWLENGTVCRWLGGWAAMTKYEVHHQLTLRDAVDSAMGFKVKKEKSKNGSL